jgi:subtilisin family serine protease
MKSGTKQSRPGRNWSVRLACALFALGVHAISAATSAVDGEIIVRLRDEGDIAPLLVKYQLSLVGRLGSRPIYRLKVIGDARVDQKINALRHESDVQSAEPNVSYGVIEPVKNVAWAIGDPQPFATQWAGPAIHLDQAHRLSTGAGVRVAVLDTGVDRRHPALAGKLLPGFDFVDFDSDPSEVGSVANQYYGHGTHVAGLVALVAPDARIMPVRILDADGVGNAWVLAEAMLYAVDPDGNPDTDDGAHVINLSLSSPTKTDLFATVAKLVSCKSGSAGANKTYVAGSLGDKARCTGFGGAVVIAAAGNHASEAQEYPAAESSTALLSVAASDSSGWLSGFSNRGGWIELAAPGEDVTSTVPGGGYATWSGTSMAAPLASGAAALLRATDWKMQADQLLQRLRDSGDKVCGTGMKGLNIAAALAKVHGDDKRDCNPPPN